MKIGLYLGYSPMLKFSIIEEGLGRYFAQLIKQLEEANSEITIACPKWCVGGVEELLDEYNIASTHIEFVTPRVEPVLWRFYKNFLEGKPKHKKSIKVKLKEAIYDGAEQALALLAQFTSVTAFFLVLLLILVLGILLSPIFAVMGLLYFSYKLTCKILTIKSITPTSIFARIKKIALLGGWLPQMHDYFRRRNPWETLRSTMRVSATNEIVRRINKMRHPADLWYCTSASWPEFSNIKGVTVTCFPDIIPAVFPQDFAELGYCSVTNAIRQSIKNGKYFITYSEYQRHNVLAALLGVPEENIKAIPLFVNEMSQDVDFQLDSNELSGDSRLRFARSCLEDLLHNALHNVQPFLQTPFTAFSFRDVRYIFYPAQNRPSKNILALIKAYEYLLRKKDFSFKLILTGNLIHNTRVCNYVYDKRLQFDVLSLPNVSNQQLSALYCCADLVVNPSLYEGGLIMTIAEGMSVGTPSIMSRIPQTMEELDSYGLDEYTFDPFDHMAIADKIVYGLEHRAELILNEQKLYADLLHRTNEKGYQEYIDAFEYFVSIEKRKT